MKLTWHIVLKDLRRLRFPLLLWVLLMVGRLVLYAMISGLIGPGNAEWLDYLRQGPALLLRATLDPVIVFILVGWLGYEDPLAARDAFWITRPISGGRLLGAKLFGAGLMFGLLPVLVNLPWWLACSLSFRQIVLAAGLLAAPLLAVAVVGLAFAALTDGFPRYLLWSLVSLAVVGIIELGVDLSMSLNLPEAGQIFSQLVVALAGVMVISLVILCYQFLTRRLARALVMLAIGLITIRVLVSFPMRDFTEVLAAQASWRPAGPGQPAAEPIRLSVAGVTSYQTPSVSGNQAPWGYLEVPLLVEGLPDNDTLSMRATGKWSWNGSIAWSARGKGGGPSTQDLLRRMLKLPGYDAPTTVTIYGMTVSKILADRMVRESPAFRANAAIYLLRCTILAEIPLKEGRVRNENGSYSIIQVWRKKLRWPAVGQSAHDFQVLSLETSQRSGKMLEQAYDLLNGRRRFARYVLVNREDGRAVDGHFNQGSDGLLGLVGVAVGTWSFDSPAGPEWFDHATLISLELRADGVIDRTIETNGFRLVEKPPSTHFKSKRNK